MSNFRLEKKFTAALAVSLLHNRICIIITSSLFFCVVLGASFMVSYGESDLKDNTPTSKYVDKNFFENIKSREHNVWFGIEAGISYMRMQKVWDEELPTFGDASDNSAGDSPKNTSGDFPSDSPKNTSAITASQRALQEKILAFFKNNTRNPEEHKTKTMPTVVSTATSTPTFTPMPTVVSTATSTPISIDILKFDPHLFDFSVYSALWNKGNSQTLAEWSASKNLIAAINASMFLPDGITSNGYLRKGVLLNNKRQGTRLGGFFVADPKKNQAKDAIILPPVAIIYRDDSDLSRFTSDKSMSLNAVLDKYNVVVQNFRLLEREEGFENIKLPVQNTNSKPQATLNNIESQSKNPNQVNNKPQKNTWNSSKRHAIAAIAEDANGNILFLHSQSPITIQNFINAIKDDSTLNLRRALYTEGGRQASMSLTMKDTKMYWPSQNSILFMLTGKNKLPNIIGVKRK